MGGQLEWNIIRHKRTQGWLKVVWTKNSLGQFTQSSILLSVTAGDIYMPVNTFVLEVSISSKNIISIYFFPIFFSNYLSVCLYTFSYWNFKIFLTITNQQNKSCLEKFFLYFNKNRSIFKIRQFFFVHGSQEI